MTKKQLEAMQAGKERARQRRIKRAIERVKAFRRWCDEDSRHLAKERELQRRGLDAAEVNARIGGMPPLEGLAAEVTDSDYRLAREAGAIL